MSRSFSHLKGKRLGKNERSILLAAGSPGSTAPLILRTPAGATSMQESFRRAAWRLERLEMIRIAKLRESTRVHDPRAHRPVFRNGGFYVRNDKTRRQYVDVLVCWLTDFGEALVNIYRPELTDRRPIRWREDKYELAVKAAKFSTTSAADWKSAKSDISIMLEQTPEPIQGETPYVPPGCGPQELGRWDLSVRVASMQNPRAGSARLLDEANTIMISAQSDEALRKAAANFPPDRSPGITAPMRPLPSLLDYAGQRDKERCLRMESAGESGPYD